MNVSMDWFLDNLEYVISVTFFTIVGVIGKLIHKKYKSPNKICPNLKIIENDLNGLKKQFDAFEGEIKGVIDNEIDRSLEIHKMLFDKIDEIGSKIDYTRGQVDQHLKHNK